MTIDATRYTALADADLLAQVTRLAANERQATAQLIAALMELDARRLYLGQGCSSLFTYCTQVLHLSEHAAYGRIEACRAARRFPVILERLADGSLTITAVGLLAPHLTPENHLEVLEAARHRPKREVEEIVARVRPQPDVRAIVRKLPTAARPVPAAAPTPASPPTPGDLAGNQPTAAPAPAERPRSSPQEPVGGADSRAVPPPPRAEVVPLAPERYKLQVTISGDTMRTLRQVPHLLRHAIPHGDLSAILDRALALLLAHLERTKLGATAAPRTPREPTLGSRHIPAAVRRAVWARDGGQCAFVGAAGRCTARDFLETSALGPMATPEVSGRRR